MLGYTVIWDADVEAPFIDAWVNGDPQTRANLTKIANWVDKALGSNPENKGQLRQDLSARILEVPVSHSSLKVAVTYTISESDRLVRVVRITFAGVD
jgi:hypothetical protein